MGLLCCPACLQWDEGAGQPQVVTKYLCQKELFLNDQWLCQAMYISNQALSSPLEIPSCEPDTSMVFDELQPNDSTTSTQAN